MGMKMVASHQTVDKIIKVLLKYVDRETAHKLARDLYCHVKGNQSVIDTFRRIAERLLEEEEEA
jgi:cytochrome c-type biogenesis protein CcmH/NrfF